MAAQLLPQLSPPGELGGDGQEHVVVAENMVEMVEKEMAFDGGKGMEDFETKAAKQEEQEEQWPPPKQQQQQHD